MCYKHINGSLLRIPDTMSSVSGLHREASSYRCTPAKLWINNGMSQKLKMASWKIFWPGNEVKHSGKF